MYVNEWHKCIDVGELWWTKVVSISLKLPIRSGRLASCRRGNSKHRTRLNVPCRNNPFKLKSPTNLFLFVDWDGCHLAQVTKTRRKACQLQVEHWYRKTLQVGVVMCGWWPIKVQDCWLQKKINRLARRLRVTYTSLAYWKIVEANLHTRSVKLQA